MVKNSNPVFCILNGYPKTSRENFDRQNVGHPHHLYKEALLRLAPGCRVDVLFIADPETSMPEGASIGAYDGFVWTGSDLTIYHRDDVRVTRQIELARAIFRAGVPSFGSCWGIQMAAVAAGGEVKKNPNGREWGIARDIRLTEAGRSSPLLKGKPDKFDGFIMHLDEVTRLPAGASLLATNAHTYVQALEVRHGKGVFWATQYHPEYNLLEMARLIAARAEPLVREGFFSETGAVKTHAEKMRALHQSPQTQALREELKVGEDILSAEIREREIKNWIEHLVLRGPRTRSPAST